MRAAPVNASFVVYINHLGAEFVNDETLSARETRRWMKYENCSRLQLATQELLI
jgi:hypothetical protein